MSDTLQRADHDYALAVIPMAPDDDDLCHVVCSVCYPNESFLQIALCGLDVSLEERLYNENPAFYDTTCKPCDRLEREDRCPAGHAWRFA